MQVRRAGRARLTMGRAMRRVKSTPMVTGRLYRATGAVTLGLAFVVAMLAADDGAESEPDSTAQRLAAGSAPARSATARPAVRAGSSGEGLVFVDGAAAADMAFSGAERSGVLAYLGDAARLDSVPAEATDGHAPPPGYARDPDADRPTPQQLERLIAQSYARSGSAGGGD